MAHLTDDPSNTARWIVFYPIYIDSTKTTKEGRRIPKELVRSVVCFFLFLFFNKISPSRM
jgi:hypothetical protein